MSTATEPSLTPDPAAMAAVHIPRINIGVFCDNANSAAIIQAAAADRRVAKAHVNVQLGGIPGAAQFYANEPTPNVVIVESHGDRNTVMAELGQFAEVCGPNTKVIVLGHVNDIQLYRELMKNHVSDYIVAPFTSMQIINAVGAIYADPNARPLGRVIAFVGSKGGVGSSTIAHNVAYATSQLLDTETILTDLDLTFGTASLNFNQEAAGTIHEALASPDRVDATLIERLMSKLGNKLSLLNGPGSVEKEHNFDAHAVETVMNVVRQAAPIVVLDVPNAWAPWVKHTLMNADEIVITATPELPSLRNAKNLVDLLKANRKNDRHPRLVLNQVGVPKRPEIPTADFGKALGLTPTAVINYDPQTFGTAQGNGQMLFEMAPKAQATGLIQNLANQLVGFNRAVDVSAPKSKFALSGLMQKLPLMKKKEG